MAIQSGDNTHTGQGSHFIIAHVKSVYGEVYAVDKDGHSRLLKAGDAIYSDEVVDTTKGDITLVQDGELVLQTDINTIFDINSLTPDQRHHYDEIVKQIEIEEGEELRQEILSGKFQAPLVGPDSQEMHLGAPEFDHTVVNIENPISGTATQPVFNLYFTPPTPELIHVQPLPPAAPPSAPTIPSQTIVEETSLDQTFINGSPSATDTALTFLALSQNNSLVKMDISGAMDLLANAHPQTQLIISVLEPSNLVSDAGIPTPIIIPGILYPNMLGGSFSPVSNGNNTVSYEYIYTADQIKQGLIQTQIVANSIQDNINAVTLYDTLLNSQISGLSHLTLTSIQAVQQLEQKFSDINNQILANQTMMAADDQNIINAQNALTNWESQTGTFVIGANIVNTTNADAITQFENIWMSAGGTSATMPSGLQALYDARKPIIDNLNQLTIEEGKLTSEQNILTMLRDSITNLVSGTYNSITEFKNALALEEGSISGQQHFLLSQNMALQTALHTNNVVLRTGIGNDVDFSFKVDVMSANPANPTPFYEQSSNPIIVDATGDGVKVDFKGHLTSDQLITCSTDNQFDHTEVTIKLNLQFADPTSDESIVVTIPGFANVPWTLLSSSSPWSINPITHDLTLTVDKAGAQNLGLSDTLVLSIDNSILRTVDLTPITNLSLNVHSVDNTSHSSGDLDPIFSNNTLDQTFSIAITNGFPKSGFYLIENTGLADVLANANTEAADVDISKVLNNLSDVSHLLTGTALTNFYINSKIIVTFSDVNPVDVPIVTLNDGDAHGFQNIGNNTWVLTGQALHDYVDTWLSAKNSNDIATQIEFENPLLVPAAYGAADFRVGVEGIVNGLSHINVQPTTNVFIDPVLQGITDGSITLVPNSLKIDNDETTFQLKINVMSNVRDGLESRQEIIDLTDVFPASVTQSIDPGWFVVGTSSPWKIVNDGGSILLEGTFEHQGSNFNEVVTLGFNTQILQNLPSPTFTITLPGSVTSTEDLPPDDPFSVLNGTTSINQPINSGSFDVPAGIFFLKEREGDDSHSIAGFDSVAVGLSAAFDYLVSQLSPAEKAILDSGNLPADLSALPGLDELVNNRIIHLTTQILSTNLEAGSITEVELIVNGQVTHVAVDNAGNATFDLNGSTLFNLLHAWDTATTTFAQNEAATLTYMLPQYAAGEANLTVTLVDNADVLIGSPQVPDGVILGDFNINTSQVDPKELVFDAVGSGTGTPSFTVLGVNIGAGGAVLTMNMEVDAKDSDKSEKVTITINLPDAPDASHLKAGAPSNLTFNWSLGSQTDPHWTLNGNTLTATFDTGPNGIDMTHIASNLQLQFNSLILNNLSTTIPLAGLINASYSITSTDASVPNSPAPGEYSVADNTSSPVTGSFSMDVSSLVGVFSIRELDNHNFDAVDASSAAKNQVILVDLSGVMHQLDTVLSGASPADISNYFGSSSSNITVSITKATIDLTQTNQPVVGYDDPNHLVTNPANTNEQNLLTPTSIGTTIITGSDLQTLYTAWVNSNANPDLRSVPDLAIFGAPFQDIDFKLNVTGTVTDTSDANPVTVTEFDTTKIIVDAHAVGAVDESGNSTLTANSTFAYEADSTTDALTGNILVTFNVDATFLDLTGKETHQATIDLSQVLPNTTLQSMSIASSDSGLWIETAPGVFARPSFISDATHTELKDNVTIRFSASDLPPGFLDFSTSLTNQDTFNGGFSLTSTRTSSDLEVNTTDNTLVQTGPTTQTTLTSEVVQEYQWSATTDVGILSLEDPSLTTILPIPITKLFLDGPDDSLNQAGGFNELMNNLVTDGGIPLLTSDALNSRTFTFTLTYNGTMPTLNANDLPKLMFILGTGANKTITRIDLDTAHSGTIGSQTQLEWQIPGNILKQIVDSTGGFLSADISLLEKNIFLQLPSSIDLTQVTFADLSGSFLTPGNQPVEIFRNYEINYSQLVGPDNHPLVNDLVASEVSHQVGHISLDSALNTLYSQLVTINGNFHSIDIARLEASQILIDVKGLPNFSEVYMPLPNSSAGTEVKPNAFEVSLITNADEWVLTGTNLRDVFFAKYGANLDQPDTNTASPQVGIIAPAFSGFDYAVNGSVQIASQSPGGNPTSVTFLPDTLFVVDDSSQGIHTVTGVGNVVSPDLDLQLTHDIKYSTDSTSGSLKGQVDITFSISTAFIDPKADEQHILALQLDTVNPLSLNPPAMQIVNDVTGFWTQYDANTGHDLFIGKPSTSSALGIVPTTLTVRLNLADLVAKGWLLDKDTSQPELYQALNQIATELQANLKVYSTVDPQITINDFLNNPIVINMNNNVEGFNGSTSNDVKVNTTSDKVDIKYSSIPETTQNTQQDLNTPTSAANSFYFDITTVMSALKSELDLLGETHDDTKVSQSSITITIRGSNTPTLQLADNVNVFGMNDSSNNPQNLSQILTSSSSASAKTYILNSDNLVQFFNAWETADAATKAQMTNWFITSQQFNDHDFTVRVEYKVPLGADATLPTSQIELIPEQLIVVRALADSVLSPNGDNHLIASGPLVRYVGLEDASNIVTGPQNQFDWNATELSRMYTNLNLKIDFTSQAALGDSTIISLTLPKAGTVAVAGAQSGLTDFAWVLVPGQSNGWVMSTDGSGNTILTKSFAPADITNAELTDTIGLSFSSLAVAGFPAPVTSGDPLLQPVPASTIQVGVGIDTTVTNFDLGGGVLPTHLSTQDTATIFGTANMSIPVFTNAATFNGGASDHPPFDASKDDYYFFGDFNAGGHNIQLFNPAGTLGAAFPNGTSVTGNEVVFGTSSNDVFNGSDVKWVSGTPSVQSLQHGNLEFVGGAGHDILVGGGLAADATKGNDILWANGMTPTGIQDDGVGVFIAAGFSATKTTTVQSPFGYYFPNVTDVVFGGAGKDTIFAFNPDAHVTPLYNASHDPNILSAGASNMVNIGVEREPGVLIDPGPGDNVIFTGGGNIIMLDNALGLERAIPQVTTLTAYISTTANSGTGQERLVGVHIAGETFTDGGPVGGPAQSVDLGGLNSNHLFNQQHDFHYFMDTSSNAATSNNFYPLIGTSLANAFSGTATLTYDVLTTTQKQALTPSSTFNPADIIDPQLHYYDQPTVTHADQWVINPAVTTANIPATINSAYDPQYTGNVFERQYDPTVQTAFIAQDTATSSTLDFRAGSQDSSYSHGNNTLVYWKDSVGTTASASDLVLYFDTTKDKVNLTGLFDQLGGGFTNADGTPNEQVRLNAIQILQINTITPVEDYNANNNYSAHQTSLGERVTVHAGNTTYYIADFADITSSTAQSSFTSKSIFDVVNLPQPPDPNHH